MTENIRRTRIPTALRPIISTRWLPLLLVVSVAVPAWAGGPTDDLRRGTDQVLRILDDPAATDKRTRVHEIAVKLFDGDETARLALGPHWQARTPSERADFARLFADLLERVYFSKIDLYGGAKLRYTDESIDGDHAVVRSKMLTVKGTELRVDVKMLRRGEHWLIYDVDIMNVSLIANYRTQFDRIIRTTSYDELVRRLEDNRDQSARGNELTPRQVSH